MVIPEEAEGRKVTIAGGYSFGNNDKYIGVKLPDTMREIEEFAFSNDENLEIVVCGAGLEIIGTAAFFGNSSLREVVLNDGLKEIGEDAFFTCENLESVTIPESVEVIGNLAFCKDGNEDLVIKGKAGSVAETFAKENNIKFEAIA